MVSCGRSAQPLACPVWCSGGIREAEVTFENWVYGRHLTMGLEEMAEGIDGEREGEMTVVRG